jgi:hypothetical protein
MCISLYFVSGIIISTVLCMYLYNAVLLALCLCSLPTNVEPGPNKFTNLYSINTHVLNDCDQYLFNVKMQLTTIFEIDVVGIDLTVIGDLMLYCHIYYLPTISRKSITSVFVDLQAILL